MKKTTSGFTIVELLIVIVVIAILASISLVSYNGIQQRARDAKRTQDISTIQKALEIYYADNGRYPAIASSNSSINSSWSTSSDASWVQSNSNTNGTFSSLRSALVPTYISELPSDPVSTPNANVQSGGNIYNYAYFADGSGSYCGPIGQTYILLYRYESAPRKQELIGDCKASSPYTTLGPYAGPSNYRMTK